MTTTAMLPLSILFERDETVWLEVMSQLAAEGRYAEMDYSNLSECLSGNLFGRRNLGIFFNKIPRR